VKFPAGTASEHPSLRQGGAEYEERTEEPNTRLRRSMIHAIHDENVIDRQKVQRTFSCRETGIWNRRIRNDVKYGIQDQHVTAWTRTPKHDVKYGIIHEIGSTPVRMIAAGTHETPQTSSRFHRREATQVDVRTQVQSCETASSLVRS